MLRVILIIGFAVSVNLATAPTALAVVMNQNILAAQMAANNNAVTWEVIGEDATYDVQGIDTVMGLTLEDNWHLTIAAICAPAQRSWPGYTHQAIWATSP